MKRIALSVLLFSLLLAGCMPLASVPVATQTGPQPVNEPEIKGETAAPSPAPTDAPTAAPTAAADDASSVAYIGRDGNVWLVDVAGGEKTPVTRDAADFDPAKSVPGVTYENPAWSSDGRYLAFTRQVLTPHTEGAEVTHALQVYDFETGETFTALDGPQTTGFAWKPDSHLLTYGLGVANNYFLARGKVDASLATGILAFDVDTRAASHLVEPEAGLSLSNPVWSPDGKIVSFDEVLYMEGQGSFAFYDFAAGKYTRWEKAIGNVSWAPDGSRLLYDNLTYMANYSERVFEIGRDRSGKRQLSPNRKDGYAAYPQYSPNGSLIAYADVQGLEPDEVVRIMLLPAAGGEARELIQLTRTYQFGWTPDGQSLLVASGEYPEMQVALVAVVDGAQTPLADGWQAALRP